MTVGVALVASLVTPRRYALSLVVVGLLGAAGVLRGSADAAPGALAAHVGDVVGMRGTVEATGWPGVVVIAESVSGGIAAEGERILLTGSVPRGVETGDVVTVQGTVEGGSSRPGPRSLEALDRDGVSAVVSVSTLRITGVHGSPQRLLAQMRTHIRAAVDSVLPQPDAALTLGAAMGIHETVDGSTRGVLQDAGLYHIVAVSGLKVVIVLGMVGTLLARSGWSPRRRGVAGLVAVALYVVTSGAGAAALRCALLAAVALWSRRDGRRVDSYVALSCIAAALAALEPRITFDVGYQLSFLGTAGILLLASPIAARIPGPRLVIEPFAVTLAAQVATIPVMVGAFGVLSLVGPAANAVALPLLPALVGLGILGSCLAALSPVLGYLPLHMTAVLLHAMLGIASVAAAVPFAVLHAGNWPQMWTVAECVGVAVGVVAAHALGNAGVMQRVAAAAAAGALAAVGVLGCVALVPAPSRITVLDVGAGSAVLIEPSGGGRFLVGGGGDPGLLATAMGRRLPPGVMHLNAVVITSAAQDSVAGLAALRNAYTVDTVVVAVDAPGASADIEALRLGGATVYAGLRTWDGGGLHWHCVVAAPGVSRPACLLHVSGSGLEAVIAGDTPPPDQAVAAGAFTSGRGGLAVAPASGLLSPELIAVVAPLWRAAPSVAGHPPPGSDDGMLLTGRDGDLVFIASEAGMERSA